VIVWDDKRRNDVNYITLTATAKIWGDIVDVGSNGSAFVRGTLWRGGHVELGSGRDTDW